MRSNPALHDPAAEPGPRWPARVGRALLVTAVQVMTAVAVVAVAWAVAANASSDTPDSWAGLGYLIMGLLLAPAAAWIAGLIAAVRARLPLWGLYALPIPLSVLAGYGASHLYAFNAEVQFGITVFLAGNVLIALVTARLPLRPRRTGTPS